MDRLSVVWHEPVGYPSGPNLFAELLEFQGPGAVAAWRIFGSHRLWHSPEDAVRTYYPDNQSVHVKPTASGLIVQQETKATDQHAIDRKSRL